jgi:chorismate dehydratase
LGSNFAKLRVGAVSYLNSVPLIWGMLEGPQREQVDLSFSIPSLCAEQVGRSEIEIGLVPVAEIARQGFETVPGVGIACFGAVRSILLFSCVPWRRIRSLTADAGSRTSVQLARIILRERFGVEPEISEEQPHLDEMLSHADAALIIGDAALRLNPEKLGVESLDLGAEWLDLTGLPFVFAAWAGRSGIPIERLSKITRGSYEFGKERLSEIVRREYRDRGITRELAECYLTHHIRFELGARELEGLETFLRLTNLAKTELAAQT